MGTWKGGDGECCGVTLGSTEEECRQSGASRTDENNQGLTLKGENIMRWRNMLVVCTVKKKKRRTAYRPHQQPHRW